MKHQTTAHDTKYVIDIVFSYRRLLLFGTVFGALIFGSGYYIGFYRARVDINQPAAWRSASTLTSSSSGTPVSSARASEAFTQVATPGKGAVPRKTEQAAVELSAPVPETVDKPSPPSQQPSAPGALLPPIPEPVPDVISETSAPTHVVANRTRPPARRTVSTLHNARGNVYLQIAAFREKHEAARFANGLSAEGFRTLIDGQLVRGKHAVLVGPFHNFESAVSKRRGLKARFHEAFPVRR